MENNKRFNPYVSVDAEEEIVISGIAGRFPNSNNIKEFQDNLFNKIDLGSSDHQRWNNYVVEMPPRIGNMNNIQKFDAEFFNISLEEADVIDPGCRMLLEHTYEAIIDGGINPVELQGTNTSVITAINFCDTYIGLVYDKPQIAGLPILGCNKGVIANRISYWLGVTGPSYNIDTASSSSHFAMVEAYRMIRSGICEAAIVASVNLCAHPNMIYQLFRLGVLSNDGYCKPYDEEGSGYMRSDAAVVVYLQKAKDARRIYATFVYGKTNCDGFKKEGITFPSFDKQKILLEEFYKECDISPLELSYIEAHATGTLAGDPVELRAIDEAICAKRQLPLLLGSVKSNMGHSEPVSGLCQIAKIRMQSILYKVLQELVYEEISNEEDFRKRLRQEAAKWACFFGDRICKDTANLNLKRHLANPQENKLLPWWKEWTYCNGLKFISHSHIISYENSTWWAVHRMGKEKFKTKVLEFLACPEHPDFIIDYLNMIGNNSETSIMLLKDFRDQDYINCFLLTIAKYARKDKVLNFILNKFKEIKPKKISRVVTLTVLINHLYSKEQLKQMNKFLTENFEKFRNYTIRKIQENLQGPLDNILEINAEMIRQMIKEEKQNKIIQSKLDIRSHQIESQIKYLDNLVL